MIINGKGFRLALRQLMRDFEMRPAKLGTLVGATEKTVQSWLDGKHDPSKAHYIKLIAVYREFIMR